MLYKTRIEQLLGVDPASCFHSHHGCGGRPVKVLRKRTSFLQLAIAIGGILALQPAAAELLPSQLNSDFSLDSVGQRELLFSGDQLDGNLTFNANDSVFGIGYESVVTGDITVTPGVTGAELILHGSGAIGTTLGDPLGVLQLNARTSEATIRLLSDINALSVVAGSNGNQTDLVIEDDINFSDDLVLFNADTKLNMSDHQLEVGGLLDISGASISLFVGTEPDNQFQISTAAGSGFIHSNSLIMSQTQGERFSFNYKQVPAHGSRYLFLAADTVVDSDQAGYSLYAQNESGGRVEDNSYLVDSSVVEGEQGLELVVSRPGGLNAENAYIAKSGTAGNFSNPAVWTLGNIAAEGSQSEDMAYVIDMLERDENGLVSDEESLKQQVELLAPIANMASFRALDSYLLKTAQSVSNRLLVGHLADAQDRAQSTKTWVATDLVAQAVTGADDYNGFSSQSASFAVGAESWVNDRTRLGFGLNVGSAETQQRGFRKGDESKLTSTGIQLYGGHSRAGWLSYGSLQLEKSEVSATRKTAINREAKSSRVWNSGVLTAGLGYSIRLANGRSTLTPSITTRISRFSRDAFSETNAGDLSLVHDKHKMKPNRLGAQLDFRTHASFMEYPADSGFTLGLFKTNQLGGSSISTQYSDASNSSFETKTMQVDSFSIELGADTRFYLKENWQLKLGLDFKHRTREQQLAAKVELKWN